MQLSLPKYLNEMRKTLRRHSKNPISKLKKEAWRVFSLWIRKRDNFTCFTCGKADRGEVGRFMQAGHFISRKHSATMFNEKNVNAQCMNCNLWGYGNMGVYTLKLQAKYGEGIIKELTAESQKIKKFTEGELQEIIGKYSL